MARERKPEPRTTTQFPLEVVTEVPVTVEVLNANITVEVATGGGTGVGDDEVRVQTSAPVGPWDLWVDTDATGTALDHGSLAGLGDDDHPQYLKPSEVLAGSNITVNTTTTPGSVVISSTATGGTMDHGSLTGLGDDDHPQYLLPGDVVAGSGIAVDTALQPGKVIVTSLGGGYGDHLVTWSGGAWHYRGAVVTARPTGLPTYAQGARVVWDTSLDPAVSDPPPLALAGDVWTPHGDVDPLA